MQHALVFVHGSATDQVTWTMQRDAQPLLPFSRVFYDRYPNSVVPAEGSHLQYHVEQLRKQVLDVAQDGSKVYLVGQSFGAVVALELLRAADRPAAVVGGLLCEVPLHGIDNQPAMPVEVRHEIVKAKLQSNELAAETFLRAVLGEEMFMKIPRIVLAKSITRWPEIESDCSALDDYEPRYPQLLDCLLPITLVRGAQSPPFFDGGTARLAKVLPNVHIEVMPQGGHLCHAEAWRHFNPVLAAAATAAFEQRS